VKPAPLPRESQSSSPGRLVESLRNARCYPHAAGSIRIIETHISWVLLTGTFAYKIKKPVNLGFLDFSTLEKRRYFCEEELRLNARLAPAIYVDVVPIVGTLDSPRVGGDGEPIDYALRMREFPQEAMAEQVLARDEMTSRHMDTLAEAIARFHASASCASRKDDFGTADSVLAPALQNFPQIRALPGHAEFASALKTIESWTRREHERLRETFGRRKQDGRVRECHGDLHLGNLVFLNDQAQAFDCIEFNPALRWIDVMNDVAFLFMDLQAQGRPDLARRYLNTYLEFGGDYEGLQVLRYYAVYRAMVRAKVTLIRAGQTAGTPGTPATGTLPFQRYLAVAEGLTQPDKRFLLITHGFSGSGKTTLTQPLIESSGAIRIRSDVERKRLHGLAPAARSDSAIAEGLYRSDATQATYQRLLDLAGIILATGHGVIVDATFLHRSQRDLFCALARDTGVPFVILDFRADESLLRERIRSRSLKGEDASEADLDVLEHQLRTHEPLSSDELESVFVCDASWSLEQAALPQTWASLLQRLACASG
jgi:uncharacterized protein